MKLAGVDGCPAGWIAAYRELGEAVHTAQFATAAELVGALHDCEVIAIDVPIGLVSDRLCDREARRCLGPMRGSSVFPAPIREVFAAKSPQEANEISRQAQNKGMPRQAWGIVRKVAEIDALLQSSAEARQRVYEVHPEVSFCLWRGEPIIESKKKRAGKAIRQQLIRDYFGDEAFASARARHSRKDVADDDIADAFAALWTAERIARGESVSYPVDPPRDATGLPMRIVA